MKRFTFALLFLLIPSLAFASNLSLPAVTVSPSANGETYSVNLQIILLMTLLSVIPGLLMAMTSFTRIIIVLSMLRQAIGLGQTPTNQILIGISLFLTFFVMWPVFNQINQEAIQPYISEQIDFPQALNRATQPLKQFMLRQTRKNDLALFEKFGKEQFANVSDIPMQIVIPAFVTSELKTAFQIGFILFLPF